MPFVPNLGGPELIIILVIVLLLFGAKRIPELAKGLGSGVREFRKSSTGNSPENEEENNESRESDDGREKSELNERQQQDRSDLDDSATDSGEKSAEEKVRQESAGERKA